MKELDILQAILQETGTGWWEIDVAQETIRMSDLLRNLLGIGQTQIPIEVFRRFVPREYTAEKLRLLAHNTEEQTLPLDSPRGRIWLRWKTLRYETDAQGHEIVTGYVRHAERFSGPGPDGGASERVNVLLYRLNNISRTLLSLLKTDDAVTVTDKILSELLPFFHGGRAYIIEFDFARRIHVCTHEVTTPGVTPERETVYPMDEMPWWTERLMNGIPIVVSTPDDLPPEAWRERRVLRKQDIHSLIVMPLVSRDKVWGYVGIDIVDRVHVWSGDDRLWFASLVNIIGLCLELQRSEQEAQNERSYLQALYQHMPLGYVRMKVFHDAGGEPCDYRIDDVNLAAAELIGCDPAQLTGRRAVEEGIDPTNVLPVLSEVLRTGRFCERDAYDKLLQRYVHSVFYTIRKDEVVCLFSDMTEVHEAHQLLDRNEKLLRNIFENMQIGVELYDRHGTLVDLNNKDMEIFGIADKADVLGVNFFDNPNVPPEIRDEIRDGHDQAFRTNYPFRQIEGYFPSSKTGYLEVYTTVNMLYDRNGKIVNFMLINIDNTEITAPIPGWPNSRVPLRWSAASARWGTAVSTCCRARATACRSGTRISARSPTHRFRR